MPVALFVELQDSASPTVRQMAERASSPDVLQVSSRAAANTVRDWFRQRNASHANDLGGKRTNWWSKAASATSSAVVGSEATVSTTQRGVRYQLEGGEIRPSGRLSTVTGEPITRLAIPARTEAYGRLPGEFQDLELQFPSRPGGAFALVQRASQAVSFGKPRKDGTRAVKRGAETMGGLVMYWLVERVRKAADPSVLPPGQLVGDAMTLAVLQFLTRAARRGQV